MDDLIVIGGALLGVAVLAKALMRLWHGSINFLPSLGWCLLMLLPFVLEFPLFNIETRGLHAFTVLLFMGLIFVTDTVADKYVPPAPTKEPSAKSLHIGYLLAALYIAITGFHLATAQTIPLSHLFIDGVTRPVIDQARLEFSRGYDFIPGLRYLFVLSTPLLGMPAVLLLWSNRRFAMAVVLFLWVLLYCVTGTAKGPFILANLIAFIGVLSLSHRHTRLLIARTLMSLGFAALLGILVLSAAPSDKNGVLSDLPAKYQTPDRMLEGRPMLLGDYIRARKDRQIPGPCTNAVCRTSEYLVYRVLLTPIEVSARWFEYFNMWPVQDKTLSRKINDTRSGEVIHPAKAVGKWAYYEPFSNEYSEIANAYPSLDADSYGRWGWMGLGIVALMFTALRLAAVWLRDTSAVTHGIYYTVTVALFTLLPANSSVQAMLLAHGLACILMVLSGMYLSRIYRLRITSV